LLAFEAGARLITQIDIFEWACNLVEQRKSEIVEPSRVIYIDVPPVESKIRATLAKMDTPDFLFSPEFTGGFKNAFKTFEAKNPDRFTFIDGCRPYSEVLLDISERICSKAGVNPNPASILK
jgi:thymidylate kinase